MTRRTRMAMIGLGQWGPNLLRNLRENPSCEVAAICDCNPHRLAEFGKLLPGTRTFDTVDDLIFANVADAAVLATPAGLHADQVRLLLDAGMDVLVEKPLALDLKTARQLVARAGKLGRILMVGHTFLFNPAVRRVKQELDLGTLGTLQFIAAQRLSLGRVREDCNALWNLAPHDVSILLYWLGAMPLNVSARGMAFHEGHPQEDVAICTLEFPGRVLATISVSWMNPRKIREMTLVGSRRMLVYDDVNTQNPLTLYDQRVEEVRAPEGSLEGFHLAVRGGPETNLPVEKREPLAEEIAHFIECVGTRATPIGSGEQALQVQSVLEACDRSMKSGGRTILLKAER